MFLKNTGFIDVIIPFLLIFTVIYAVLHKTKAISEEKNIHVILSLLLAIIAILPHILSEVGRPIVPPQYDFVRIMYAVLPEVAILIIAIVLMLIVLGLFLSNVKIGGTTFGAWGTIIAILIIIGIFVINIFDINIARYPIWNRILTPQNQAILIIILVFAIIIAWVTYEPKAEGGIGKSLDKFVKVFSEIGKKD